MSTPRPSIIPLDTAQNSVLQSHKAKPAQDTLLALDAQHVWHPYSPIPGDTPQLVVGAYGTTLQLADREVVDGMSSWWAAIHGYNHPVLNQAAHDQIGAMSHVMFGGLTHEPAILLAQALAEMTGFERVFLADSGSVAVEVALKLARQVHVKRTYQGTWDTSRSKMAALTGGYHGDTWGAMSVTDPVGGMHKLFAGAMDAHVFLPKPPRDIRCHVNARPGNEVDQLQIDQQLEAWFEDCERLIEAHAHELAAIMCEPVLQGAGGMHWYPPEALGMLRQLADQHGLLLIFDEIATGFGRTGTLFARDHAQVNPDIMLVGKALTGGYISLAAVLVSDTVCAQLGASPEPTLMHGPTFMGNPLASAIALANLGILQTGAWQRQVANLERELRAALQPLADPLYKRVVADVRVRGGVGVVEMVQPVDMVRATRASLDAGAWLRPFGRLVYTMPPYIATAGDIKTIGLAMRAIVEDVVRKG